MPCYCAGLCPFSHQQGRYIRGDRTVAVLCLRRPSRIAADLLWLPNAAKGAWVPNNRSWSPTQPGRGPTFESMGLQWEQTIVEARDPAALGRWWLEALGWVVVNDDSDEFEIRPAEDRLPGLLFVSVPEPKTVKNRLHLDFRPDDRDAEVARMLALGTSPADVGQGEQSWVVLADPEGNEFCVLSSRPLTN